MGQDNKLCVGLICCVGAVVAVIAITVAAIVDSRHTITEGNVGIYYTYGALGKDVNRPGVHWKSPFVSELEMVRVRPQTDTLPSMTAVTKDGVENTFNDVQVISRVREENLIQMIKSFGLNFRKPLIFDRVKEELRIFCANSTIDEVYNTKFLEIVGQVKTNVIQTIEDLGVGGLEIINVVIPKPDIPIDIAKNYHQVKVQWTEKLVASQRQETQKVIKETEKQNAVADAERHKAVLQVNLEKQVLEKKGEQNLALLEAEHQQRLELIKKETEKQKAIANAEREKQVVEITNQARILEKEGDQKISELNNALLKLAGEVEADIKKAAIEKEAEANLKLFTPEYIKLNMAKAISPNTKYYFSGDNAIVSAVMEKIVS